MSDCRERDEEEGVPGCEKERRPQSLALSSGRNNGERARERERARGRRDM